MRVRDLHVGTHGLIQWALLDALAVSNGEARCISLANDTGRGSAGVPAPHARDFLTALGNGRASQTYHIFDRIYRGDRLLFLTAAQL